MSGRNARITRIRLAGVSQSATGSIGRARARSGVSRHRGWLGRSRARRAGPGRGPAGASPNLVGQFLVRQGHMSRTPLTASRVMIRSTRGRRCSVVDSCQGPWRRASPRIGPPSRPRNARHQRSGDMPSRPTRAARPGRIASTERASPRPSASPTGTSRPVSPSKTISGVPPAAVATMGRPAAAASRSTLGKPSVSDAERARRSHRRGPCVGNRSQEADPVEPGGSRAVPSTAARSGPSPTKTSHASGCWRGPAIRVHEPA